MLRDLTTLVTGRARPARKTAPSRWVEVDGTRVGPKLAPVKPLPAGRWIAAPEVTGSGKVVRTVYDTGTSSERYDVALLESLNDAYRDRPIVPKPRSYTSAALSSDAPGRIAWAHGLVDLQDKTVLEVGCGHGLEVWGLAHNLGCDAYGVDVRELATWSQLAGDRVHFECVDLAVTNPFPADMFDRIVSYTVWEHVAHPYALLQEAFKVLKPGGLAWLHVNLFAGPQASHRYRDIYFPWPHLLFADDVIKDWDVKHGRQPIGSHWVNRLTWDHYERYFEEIGFRVRHLRFYEGTWDEEFYTRFEDVLGRYPRSDLKRDYFVVVLEKPTP